MVDYITITEREDLFHATRNCILVLYNRIDNEDLLINERLLRRLAGAAFRCPGFTQPQKAEIAYICNMDISGKLAPYHHDWTVFNALGPKPGCEIDVLCVSISDTIIEFLTVLTVGSIISLCSARLPLLPTWSPWPTALRVECHQFSALLVTCLFSILKMSM